MGATLELEKHLTSIRARKDGGQYAVDKKSTPSALKAFEFLTKPTPALQVRFNPDAPHGDAALAAQAMKILVDHYPGYYWIVEIDDRPSVGMMNVYNQDVNAALFSNAPYGYRIFLRVAYGDPSLKCVMRAGGQILERANLNRGWNKGDAPKRVDGVRPQHQPFGQKKRVVIHSN